MSPLPEKMVRLIEKHHVFTLATSGSRGPWCASCFYVYDVVNNVFIFTSEMQTRHVSEATSEPRVSGCIALETSIIGKLRGLQFSGIMASAAGHPKIQAKKLYIKRFPYSLPFIGSSPFFLLFPEFIKMTDNRLGFGTKLIWDKSTDLQAG